MARCHVCNISKHWKHFVEGSLLNKTRNTHLRCTDCLLCPGCNKLKNANKFSGQSKTCTTCCTLWTCKPCGQSFLADKFDAPNLDNHQNSNRMDFLVCKKCRIDGYNPRDTTDYPCEFCGAKGCGLFETEELQEYKKASNAKKPKLVCKTCSKAYERGNIFGQNPVESSNEITSLILYS